jgi:hypothetical protein
MTLIIHKIIIYKILDLIFKINFNNISNLKIKSNKKINI